MSQPSDLQFLSRLLFFMSNYIIINSMSCSCGNRCFYQAINYDIFQYEEYKSSTIQFVTFFK